MSPLLKRLAAPLSQKLTRAELDQFLKQHQTTARTLDVGASTGPYARYFPNRVAVDVRRAASVDAVSDAHRLAIRDNAFERVLCTEVLEHLTNPQQAVDEMYRVLVPGGWLLLTTRFLFPIHDAPGDYFRFTKYGLQHLLARFEISELREETTSFGTLAVLIQRFAFQAETLGWRPLWVIWPILARFVRLFSFLITKEYGDALRSRRETSIMTSGYYVACRKPK